MKQITGDLIKLAQLGRFDIIAHGCNCEHVMGSGIAPQIRRAFPEAYEADLATPRGAAKLGTCSWTLVARGDGTMPGLFVINAYTQPRPGPCAELDAIRRAFGEMGRFARLMGQSYGYPFRIGYPLVGCGLGGLHWGEVGPVIEAALDGLDHTLVVLP